MSSLEGARPTLSGKRFSACMEASRVEERERVRAMSAWERMDLALALGRHPIALARPCETTARGHA